MYLLFKFKIEEIFIKDIQLSKDLQDSLSSAAKERRLAESKIISAKADVESAKLMRQAAEQLNSKAAMQIRYLDTLKTVGKSNTKVIFLPELKNKERVQHLITQGLISWFVNLIFNTNSFNCTLNSIGINT